MKKKGFPQLELFSEIKDYTEAKVPGAANSFFNRIRNYEKVILVLIGLTISVIASYSLGIEKGKRLVSAKKETDAIPKIQIQQPAPKQQENAKEPVSKDTLKNYIIQVATYRAKISAEKEATVLKKRGFLPLVLSKGIYTVVCVGNFSNKERAKSVLSEIKKDKRYQDSFIRRL